MRGWGLGRGAGVLVVAGAVGLAGCSRVAPAIGERDAPGTYQGIARVGPAGRPARLRLLLGADHTFRGHVPSGISYAVAAGRWRLGQGDADCRPLQLIGGAGAPVAACVSRLGDGAICLRWREAASGCAMTRVEG